MATIPSLSINWIGHVVITAENIQGLMYKNTQTQLVGEGKIPVIP
jgi:hypothetical protein